MSHTLLKSIAGYMQPSFIKEIDEIRGDIPRSKIMERAMMHYVNEVKSGRVKLLPGVETTATTTTVASKGEQEIKNER